MAAALWPWGTCHFTMRVKRGPIRFKPQNHVRLCLPWFRMATRRFYSAVFFRASAKRFFSARIRPDRRTALLGSRDADTQGQFAMAAKAAMPATRIKCFRNAGNALQNPYTKPNSRYWLSIEDAAQARRNCAGQTFGAQERSALVAD